MKAGKEKRHGVGIALCDCGGELRRRLDFKALRATLRRRPEVRALEICSAFCREAVCARTVRALARAGADRIVVGACPREIYEAALAAALAGLKKNQGLVASATIREHCAWAHADKHAATATSLALIEAAVRRVGLQAPIALTTHKANRDVAVLGGGLAAIRTCLALARLGQKATLLNAGKDLGHDATALADFMGYLDSDSRQATARLQQALAADIEKLQAAESVTVIPGAEVESVGGAAGNFTIAFKAGGQDRALKAGALVLAVGAFTEFPFPDAPAKPERITGLAGLADRIKAGVKLPPKIALILDYSGEQGRAVNALTLAAAELLATQQPKRQVKLFCHHVRVAAHGLEALYRRARAAGLVIVRCAATPRIGETEGGLTLRYEDGQAGAALTEEFDLVVAADGSFTGGNELRRIAGMVRRGPGGAWQFDNVWLAPANTNREGIFVVGGARGNSELREAMNDAGAVARAIHELLQGRIVRAADAAVVDAEKCVLCLTCLRTCPHGAIAIDELKQSATASAIACRRCGLCATMCPAKAIQLPRYTDDQVAAELGPGPVVTVFACENSAWPAANAAGIGRHEYGANVRLVRVPCAGKVDAQYVLRALEAGSSKVMILGCHRENCRYLFGADHAAKRVARLQAMLEQAGIEKTRVAAGNLTEFETGRFLEFVRGAASATD